MHDGVRGQADEGVMSLDGDFDADWKMITRHLLIRESRQMQIRGTLNIVPISLRATTTWIYGVVYPM